MVTELNIFAEDELDKKSTTEESSVTASDGKIIKQQRYILMQATRLWRKL